jgi:hypothetical protein
MNSLVVHRMWVGSSLSTGQSRYTNALGTKTYATRNIQPASEQLLLLRITHELNLADKSPVNQSYNHRRKNI